MDLRESYLTKDSARLFTHYIAESQRCGFVGSVRSCHFFGFLMDGTTDAGNEEDEIIAIMGFCKDSGCNSGEVGSFARFFSVQVPTRADSDGLIVCLNQAVQLFGINSVLEKADVLGSRPILIGGGTDGASVNIAQQNGMQGKMQRALRFFGVGAMPTG